MTGFVRRLAPAAGALLLAAALTACGSSNSNNSSPPVTPTPATTAASAAGTASAAINSACTDVATIKQSTADLKTDLRNKDLTAAKNSWSSLTTAVTDLGTNAKNTGSAAAQQIHDTLAPITANFTAMDSLAKLTAVVAALNVAGPALNNALTTVKTNLHCPD